MKNKKLKKILMGAASVGALGSVVAGTSIAKTVNTNEVTQGQIITVNVEDREGSTAAAYNRWSAGWGYSASDVWVHQTFLRVNNSHNRDTAYHTFVHDNMTYGDGRMANNIHGGLDITGEYLVPTDGRVFEDIVDLAQNGSTDGVSFEENGAYAQTSGAINIRSLVEQEQTADFKIIGFTYGIGSSVGYDINLFHYNYFIDSYLSIKTISYELI